MSDLWEKILSGALTLILFGWIWARSTTRSDELEKRVLAIEKDGMTRDEFVREMAVWTQDRRAMHEENQSCLREIRDQMGENEKRRSHTEHAILDVVNQLRVKQAATEAVENYRNTRSDR